MDGHKRFWPWVASTFVVAIAVAIVWTMALMWMGYLFTSFIPQDVVYEGVEITREGVPVIRSQTSFNPLSTTYRTLDGQLIDDDLSGRTVPGTSFSAPIKPPGLFELPVGWMYRIVGFSDYQRPPVNWYVVRDDAPVGAVYLAGFDQTTRLPMGYIGRNGFTRSKPARDEWFDIGRNLMGWGIGAITSSGRSFYQAQKVFAYSFSSEDTAVPSWLVFLTDGDRVLVIDLRSRTVQPLYETGGLMSVAMLYEVKPKAAVPAAQPAKEPDEPTSPDDNERTKLVTRVVVRSKDQITIFNWPSKEKRQFSMPEQLRDKSVEVNLLSSGELLVVRTGDNRKTTYLTWLRPDGKVAREQTVTLAGYNGGDDRTAAWLAAGVAPIPAGWAAVTGLFAPLMMIQSHDAASYGQAAAKVFSTAIFPFIAVLACGALLAWATLRLQRKYHRSASAVWAVFVFLLGVPGFIAYLIEHRRTKLETCGECGKIVPRDREACSACNKEFATPPPIGTEIFA